jgi:hypothetical protein
MDSFPPGYDVSPATWLYLSLVLIVAVFFRFNRVWSLRNLDLGLLLAASPGILLVENPATQGWGYSWLFAVTGLFLVRLLADPLLRRRPHLGQNLNSQGSAFLCLASMLLLAIQGVQIPSVEPAAEEAPAAETAAAETAANETVAAKQPASPGEWPAEPASDTNLQVAVADVGPAAADSAGSVESEATPGDEPDPADSQASTEATAATAGPVAPLLHAPFGVIFEVEETSARAVAVFAHLMVVVGLLLVGRNLFGDYQLGLAMATLYLLLPCTAYDVGEVNHVLPSALIVWALLAYRRPMISGILLGLACGIRFFPVFLLPVWAAYYGRRGIQRFGTALLLVASAVATFTALTTTSPDAFFRSTLGTIHLREFFAFDKLNGPGFWTQELNYYRIPVVVTFFLMLIGLTIWPRRKQLEHLSAYSAAIIVATQFWYPVQGGVYLLWYLPLLLVVVFRPRLVHLQPYSDTAETEQSGKAPAIAGPHTHRASTSAERLHLFR